MNNNKEALKKALKKKILMWIAPALPFIIVGFLIVIIAFSAILAVFGPVSMAKDSSESTDDNVGFFEKFGNFLSGNGWTSSEKAFWQILEDSNLDCPKSTLVTATIMFYYQSNPEKEMDYGEVPIDEEPVEENTSDSEGDPTEEIPEPSDDMYSDIPYGQILPDLKRLVKKMKKGNTAYEEYVKGTFLKKSPYNELLENYDNEEEGINQVYEEIVNISKTIECVSRSSFGSASCSFDLGSEEATDLKVRLLRCGNLGDGVYPLENEELIDFEKYITGVVYQEVGDYPMEAMKAQAVAARSFSLARGEAMNYALGIGKIENENGQWILSLRACTGDQAYCDPDKGCWSDATGGEYYWGKNAGVDASIHSGEDTSKKWSRPPLAEDSPIRQAVIETAGQILIDSDQKVVYTNFTQTEQTKWRNMANNGQDYYEMLINTYDSANDVVSNCTLTNGSAVGAFSTWKQCDPSWKSIPIGNKTICKIGCLATSVAIQIARSGTEVLLEDFNPGTFVQHISNNGGFSGNNFAWTGWQDIAPNFEKVDQNIKLVGSKKDKINQIKAELEKGYYVLITVKPDWGHWVAVNYVTDDEIYMFDPAPNSDGGKVFAKYSPSAVTRMATFRKTD